MQAPGILLPIDRPFPDTLPWWIEQYFLLHNTSSAVSQQIQKRDLNLFLDFYQNTAPRPARRFWNPSISIAFLQSLRNNHLSERTIDRVIAHLKKFSKWVHKLLPFPSGDPMVAIQRLEVRSVLDVNRALTKSDRTKMLTAADRMVEMSGRMEEWRKGHRPYRNRAIIYMLIETGMTRAAIANMDLENVNFRDQTVSVQERGMDHTYHISRAALKTINDYIGAKRPLDVAKWRNCPALFLTAETVRLGNGRLTPSIVNSIWNHVSKLAGVSGKTPHSARHAMGKHIMRITGSAAAVQTQLGHRSALYSFQYSTVTKNQIKEAINKR